MQIQVYTTFSVNTHQPYSTNGTAVPRENPQHDGYNKKLVYGVSIPVGVMLIIAFAMLLVSYFAIESFIFFCLSVFDVKL